MPDHSSNVRRKIRGRGRRSASSDEPGEGAARRQVRVCSSPLTIRERTTPSNAPRSRLRAEGPNRSRIARRQERVRVPNRSLSSYLSVPPSVSFRAQRKNPGSFSSSVSASYFRHPERRLPESKDLDHSDGPRADDTPPPPSPRLLFPSHYQGEDDAEQRGAVRHQERVRFSESLSEFLPRPPLPPCHSERSRRIPDPFLRQRRSGSFDSGSLRSG